MTKKEQAARRKAAIDLAAAATTVELYGLDADGIGATRLAAALRTTADELYRTSTADTAASAKTESEMTR